MKAPFFLFLLLCSRSTPAQVLSDVSVMKSTKDFNAVRDSILTLTNPSSTISLKTCEGYREFYLSKQDGHWYGFFVKNLNGALLIPHRVYADEDGVVHEEKHYRTSLLSFHADSLYGLLVKAKLDSITQLTEDVIRRKYSEYVKKPGKHRMIGLPAGSQDCDMTVRVDGPIKRSATYRGSWIDVESVEILQIPTLQIFHDIRNLLEKAFESYGYY